MSQLSELITRVRGMLEDPLGLRFSDQLLEEGVRQALQEVNDHLPQVLETEINVNTSGRDQPLTGLSCPLYLIHIRYPVSAAPECQLEPEVQFSYRMQAETPMVHFLGNAIPQEGERMIICYAARHTLAGLDGAATSTLPEEALTALVIGAAGHACVLRVHTVSEAQGVRSGEVNQLLQIAQLHLDRFEKNLNGLKVLQEFGFPRGFALDKWDDSYKRSSC